MLRRRQDKREGREKDPKLLQTSQVKIICIGLSRLTADSILSSKKWQQVGHQNHTWRSRYKSPFILWGQVHKKNYFFFSNQDWLLAEICSNPSGKQKHFSGPRYLPLSEYTKANSKQVHVEINVASIENYISLISNCIISGFYIRTATARIICHELIST